VNTSCFGSMNLFITDSFTPNNHRNSRCTDATHSSRILTK
jgi:hypothetical protein